MSSSRDKQAGRRGEERGGEGRGGEGKGRGGEGRGGEERGGEDATTVTTTVNLIVKGEHTGLQ